MIKKEKTEEEGERGEGNKKKGMKKQKENNKIAEEEEEEEEHTFLAFQTTPTEGRTRARTPTPRQTSNTGRRKATSVSPEFSPRLAHMVDGEIQAIQRIINKNK